MKQIYHRNSWKVAKLSTKLLCKVAPHSCQQKKLIVIIFNINEGPECDQKWVNGSLKFAFENSDRCPKFNAKTPVRTINPRANRWLGTLGDILEAQWDY